MIVRFLNWNQQPYANDCHFRDLVENVEEKEPNKLIFRVLKMISLPHRHNGFMFVDNFTQN